MFQDIKSLQPQDQQYGDPSDGKRRSNEDMISVEEEEEKGEEEEEGEQEEEEEDSEWLLLHTSNLQV
jgi:hypothetical protein